MEAFSIWIANHPLAEIFPWLIRIDHHPPLYYVGLHFWQALFGDLQGPVRALSALCSTLAIPVFYLATRRLFNTPTALIAALILAVSPFHVRFAQEARMYALLTLAAALHHRKSCRKTPPASHQVTGIDAVRQVSHRPNAGTSTY